jgi:hypothetical protein
MRNRALLLTLLATVGCAEGAVNPPVIDATSVVEGVVYLDFDGDASLGSSDDAIEGVRVRVVLPGSGQVVAADTTDPDGEFLMEGVPVGTVEVGVDPEALGDTLLMVPMDSIRFTLGAETALSVALGVTYPQLSLAEAREAEAGTSIFTQGVVLNSRGQAPGGAVHVEGAGVALRVLVPPAVQVLVGDSVRIQGRVGTDLGQPVLLDGRMLRVVPGARDVEPRAPTLGEARTGANGLDAALVEFTSGTVQTFETVAEGFLMRVVAGADTLDVRLRSEQGFFQGGIPEGAQVLRLVGLLVHDPASATWALVPRSTTDVRLGPPPASPRGS